MRRALFLSPEVIDKSMVDEEGYPFPSTPGPAFQTTVDVLVFPGTTPHPKLVNLPLSPLTGRLNRPDYTALLGPEPIFSSVETFAGTFIVGCQTRYEDPNLEELGEDDFHNCIMHLTQRRGGWMRWPRANVMVMKSVDQYDRIVRGDEWDEGAPKYKDATMYDIPPLARYFELVGMIPGMCF
jgi:hypothetical protein